MPKGTERNCWKEDRVPKNRIGRAKRIGFGKEDWAGRIARSKPLRVMKIPQDMGSVIPPKRAETNTRPKMDMLTINGLWNRTYCDTGKSLVIRFFHMLL